MLRQCTQCRARAVRVGRIVQSGPVKCELCGTVYEVARYQNVPYVVTMALAIAFLLALVTDRLDGVVVLALGCAFVIFDFAWELLKPLRPVSGPANDGESS